MSTRPTPEQIAEAREWLRQCVAFSGILPNAKKHAEALLAATEPPTDEEVIEARVIDARRAYFDANALNTEIERQRGVIRSQNNEIARMQEHIAALEARLDAAEVLQRVRDRIDSNYEGKTCDSILGYLDHEIANLTGPKKPTKPAGEWHSENNIGEPTGFHTGMDD